MKGLGKRATILAILALCATAFSAAGYSVWYEELRAEATVNTGTLDGSVICDNPARGQRGRRVASTRPLPRLPGHISTTDVAGFGAGDSHTHAPRPRPLEGRLSRLRLPLPGPHHQHGQRRLAPRGRYLPGLPVQRERRGMQSADRTTKLTRPGRRPARARSAPGATRASATPRHRRTRQRGRRSSPPSTTRGAARSTRATRRSTHG